MKRMTLLTVLALVFSLFTVTAAIAGSGPGTGDGEQSGDLDRLQADTRTNTDAACQGDDCPAGDMVRTQDQIQDGIGECEADDCQVGEESMAQMRERVMNKLVAMLGAESAEVEGQYRHFLNIMLQNMLQFRVLFV